MTEECPSCGAPFSEMVTVELGTRYEEAFGPPPASLFSTYARLCAEPAGVSGRSAVEVFVHSRSDLEGPLGSGD